jgi:hypothetical protein
MDSQDRFWLAAEDGCEGFAFDLDPPATHVDHAVAEELAL